MYLVNVIFFCKSSLGLQIKFGFTRRVYMNNAEVYCIAIPKKSSYLIRVILPLLE